MNCHICQGKLMDISVNPDQETRVICEECGTIVVTPHTDKWKVLLAIAKFFNHVKEEK
mgnify:CR=1 FL=1